MIMSGNVPFGRCVLPCILLEVEDNAITMGISDDVVACWFRSQNEGSVYMGRLNEKQFETLSILLLSEKPLTTAEITSQNSFSLMS